MRKPETLAREKAADILAAGWFQNATGPDAYRPYVFCRAATKHKVQIDVFPWQTASQRIAELRKAMAEHILDENELT